MTRLAFFGFLITFIPQVMSQSPLIVAHRGYSHLAPENSLSAFERAIEIGAPFLELDVQRSANGTPIVIHDESLERTTSCSELGRTDGYTDQELQSVRIGYPSKFGLDFQHESLPTLSQALELAKGRIGVCVEIKVAGIESAIIADIAKWNMEKEVVIFSFLPEVLRSIHSLAPDLKLLFLKSKARSEDLDECLALHATALGVGGKTQLDHAFLKEAAEKNIEIWRWTVDDVREMQRLKSLGIHAIITNRPDLGLTLHLE